MITGICLVGLSLFTVTVYPSEPEKIIVFITLGMPDQSIKQWVKQAEEYDASVVIRGFYKQDLHKTIKRVATLVQENSNGIQIDPNMFKKFHIKSVPAVVKIKNGKMNKVYGDVGLGEALKILESGEGNE